MKSKFLIQFLPLTLVFLSCSACIPPSPDPTSGDRAALAALHEQFGDRYEFIFQYDVYVRAQARTASLPTQTEAKQVFKVFRFDKEGRLRGYPRSHIAYFNFYNYEGEFMFQIYWNPQGSDFDFSDKPFY